MCEVPYPRSLEESLSQRQQADAGVQGLQRGVVFTGD